MITDMEYHRLDWEITDIELSYLPDVDKAMATFLVNGEKVYSVFPMPIDEYFDTNGFVKHMVEITAERLLLERYG